MKIRESLLQSPNFTFEKKLFYQIGLERPGEFERKYLSLRQREGRLYTDNIVRELPDLPSGHSLKKEWMRRKFTLEHLIKYLRQRSKDSHPAFLEVGCGNGWLSNHLAGINDSEVLGVDVNETELKQAERIFRAQKNLSFAYTDVLDSKLPAACFDYVILAASFQYFENVAMLFQQLLTLMSENGEIHILDSPFYRQGDVPKARMRSKEYFKSRNADFEDSYYHHSWDSLGQFDYNVLYDPDSFIHKILNAFRLASPFHWVRISRRDLQRIT
jgi:SAM-dependent methyltransferase